MNNLCTDIGWQSVNKFGEQLCGDHIETVTKDDGTIILVLADGLGSGVKACILSTLTSKIISTMVAADMSIEDCVSTIAATLPVCEKRGIAYSTFTIIKIRNSSEAEIIQYDNPDVILLRNGKNEDYSRSVSEICGKKISRALIKLEEGDIFVAMSDGAIYAGVGKSLNFGWQRDNIIDFLVGNYEPNMSAQTAAGLVSEQCDSLYGGEEGDDTTIAAIKIRTRKVVNLMIGPPSNPSDLKRMHTLFFAKDGLHIICGGTTSKLAADYLGKAVIPCLDYIDKEIPPTAKIDGVDLVTEGVVTITKVLSYAEDFPSRTVSEYKKDGASQLARLLFDTATDINFYVGRAINPAHQNPNLPINFSIKMNLIDKLSNCLVKMGKRVNVAYF